MIKLIWLIDSNVNKLLKQNWENKQLLVRNTYLLYMLSYRSLQKIKKKLFENIYCWPKKPSYFIASKHERVTKNNLGFYN